jgi:predicted ester cyclase
VRWRATGTHRGTFEGIEPSHQRLEFTGIEIVLVDEGRISERWGEWNGLDLVRQLHAPS